MVEVVVLADDFTGANDAGAQCARQGIPAVVSTELGCCSYAPGIRVAVIDSESRHDCPEQARDKVRRALSGFQPSCGKHRHGDNTLLSSEDAPGVGPRAAGAAPICYKKTDSTLRGNIEAELDELMNVCTVERLVYVPAYPAAGRITRQGVHYVDGVPVHESPYGRDPGAPVRESSVTALLSTQTARVVESISVEQLAQRLAQNSPALLVVDASSEADIERIAAIMQLHHTVPVAGPVGVLARLLPRWGIRPNRGPAPRVKGPILLVNGSLNEVSLRQCAWARKNGFEAVKVTADTVEPMQRDVIAARIAACLLRGENVVMFSAEHSTDLWPSPNMLSLSPSRLCADIVARAIERVPAHVGVALCIFGGETSFALVNRLGYRDVYPYAFLGDGLSAASVPATHAVSALVTKSGGFGPENVAGRVRDWVREHAVC